MDFLSLMDFLSEKILTIKKNKTFFLPLVALDPLGQVLAGPFLDLEHILWGRGAGESWGSSGGRWGFVWPGSGAGFGFLWSWLLALGADSGKQVWHEEE